MENCPYGFVNMLVTIKHRNAKGRIMKRERVKSHEKVRFSK